MWYLKTCQNSNYDLRKQDLYQRYIVVNWSLITFSWHSKVSHPWLLNGRSKNLLLSRFWDGKTFYGISEWTVSPNILYNFLKIKILFKYIQRCGIWVCKKASVCYQCCSLSHLISKLWKMWNPSCFWTASSIKKENLVQTQRWGLAKQ